LQTCNRTEIYLYAKKDIDWLKPVSELMGQLGNEAGQYWQKYCIQKRGIDVARHFSALPRASIADAGRKTRYSRR